MDAYPVPGDAIAYNNLCPRSVELIWGVDPKKPIKVEVTGTVTING